VATAVEWLAVLDLAERASEPKLAVTLLLDLRAASVAGASSLLPTVLLSAAVAFVAHVALADAVEATLAVSVAVFRVALFHATELASPTSVALAKLGVAETMAAASSILAAVRNMAVVTFPALVAQAGSVRALPTAVAVRRAAHHLAAGTTPLARALTDSVDAVSLVLATADTLRSDHTLAKSTAWSGPSLITSTGGVRQAGAMIIAVLRAGGNFARFALETGFAHAGAVVTARAVGGARAHGETRAALLRAILSDEPRAALTGSLGAVALAIHARGVARFAFARVAEEAVLALAGLCPVRRAFALAVSSAYDALGHVHTTHLHVRHGFRADHSVAIVFAVTYVAQAETVLVVAGAMPTAVLLWDSRGALP
jgi:hypothetical protein